MAERGYRSQAIGWDVFKRAREQFFQYRYGASVMHKLWLALGFALLTGIAAQIRIPLPFSPVPITLQTFVVLMTGIILGMRFGGLSQGLYVGFGVLGMPWFQGFGAGLAHLAGPTGGYLVGFIAAAVLIGFVTDRYPPARRFSLLLAILAIANFLIIYGFALPWLYVWSTVVTGGSVSIVDVLVMGFIPFVAGDIVKLVAAAAIGTLITPKHGDVRDHPDQYGE